MLQSTAVSSYIVLYTYFHHILINTQEYFIPTTEKLTIFLASGYSTFLFDY